MTKLLNLILIVIATPFLVLFIFILSLLIILVDRYSPFFSQQRIGKNGKLFRCYKLQTMRPAKSTAEENDPIKDSKRITKLGIFIRDHGFDELPQILNIMRGEMNFVGPRPLPVAQYEKLKVKYPEKVNQIDTWWQKRLEILPGLSGWHQIHLPDHNIVKYDMEYLDGQNYLRNLKIFIISLLLLLVGKRFYFKTFIPDTYEYVL